VFARYGIPVDVLATSEVSISLTIEKWLPPRAEMELARFSEVRIEPGYAIVCIVGGAIREMRGVLGKIFGAIEKYPVKMVSQGASKRNITFLVRDRDARPVIRRLFKAFFHG
jgi:aspartate kinase